MTARHMATRCIACRHCELACPADIPLTVLYALMLRDVGEDARGGRVYLPAQEMVAHGLSEADLAAGVVDDFTYISTAGGAVGSPGAPAPASGGAR